MDKHPPGATEGLTGAAGVIAVDQAAERILNPYGEYALGVNDAKENIKRPSRDVEAFRTVITSVVEMASDGEMLLLSGTSRNRPINYAKMYSSLTILFERCKSSYVNFTLRSMLVGGKYGIYTI